MGAIDEQDAVAEARQTIGLMLVGLPVRDLTPYEQRQIDNFERAIVARERARYRDLVVLAREACLNLIIDDQPEILDALFEALSAVSEAEQPAP